MKLVYGFMIIVQTMLLCAVIVAGDILGVLLSILGIAAWAGALYLNMLNQKEDSQ